MNLRGFHVVFITCATLLALFFAWWCFTAYRAEGSVGYLVAGATAAGTGVGLVIYGSWFLRKMTALLEPPDPRRAAR